MSRAMATRSRIPGRSSRERRAGRPDLCLFFALAVLIAAPAAAQRNNLPPELAEIGVEQKLGESVPLDAVFTDSTGAEVQLGDLLGERPAILAPVYYECPMICDMVLDGVTRSAKALKLEVGRDFDVIAASFDPEETPELARASKETVVARYGREGTRDSTGDGWHFLTAQPESIRRLTESIGFRYKKIEETGEFAHSAAIAVLTPEGRIAQYFYGIDYPPRDLQLGLVEASDNRIGSLVDQIVLFCYRYDPSTGKYTLAVWILVRTAALLTVAAIGSFLLINFLRERRRRVPVTP